MPQNIQQRVRITDAMRNHVPPGHLIDGHIFWTDCCHAEDCLRNATAYYGDPEKPYKSPWYCAKHLTKHAHEDILSPEEVLRALKPLRQPLVYPDAW